MGACPESRDPSPPSSIWYDPDVRVTFFGCRGSYPVARADQVRYGGNTSCHLFEGGGKTIIFDMGTGARPAGNYLREKEFGRGKGRADVFITHVMWDHIIGMPFFRPMYIKGNRFRVHAPKLRDAGLSSIFKGLYDPAFFPVPLKALAADISFHPLVSGQTVKIGRGIQVSTVLLNHPGVTLGYRLDAGGRSFCYITDTASWWHPILSDKHARIRRKADYRFRRRMENALVRFVKEADWMLFDTDFSDDDIAGKEDWGHSTPGYALHISRRARVKTLYLYHHDPEHSDSDVEKMLSYARVLAGADVDVELAREGDSIKWRRG